MLNSPLNDSDQGESEGGSKKFKTKITKVVTADSECLHQRGFLPGNPGIVTSQLVTDVNRKKCEMCN